MAMHPEIAKHLDEIRAIAAEYGVDRLEIFGSAMTDAFDLERSDVDFIVHYPDGYDYGYFLKRFQDMEAELTIALGRPAQLVMTSALKKESFRANANKTRVTVYDRKESESGSERHSEVLSIHSR